MGYPELIKDLEVKLGQAEARLYDSERRYRHLVQETEGLICTHDLRGNLLSVNPAATRLLGYAVDEMVGRNLRDFLSPVVPHEHFDIFLQKINANSVDKGTLLLAAKDGRELTFKYHNVKFTENVDEPYVLGHAYDITEIIELQQKLEELTFTDDLTGLYNRRGFMVRAKELTISARRSGESLALIFADVDGLKKINDAFGHEVGSQIIVDTGKVLRDSFRQTDVLSRWGGDEFVILLSKATDESQEIVLRRLRRKIAAFNKASDRPYKLSVSFGVAPIDPGNPVAIDEVIAEADKSMYHAKQQRKLARSDADE